MQLFRSLVVGLITLLPTGLVAGAPQHLPDQEVVARIGDAHAITFADVKAYVNNNPLLAYRPDTSSAYAQALDAMVTAQLKRIDFFERGLHNDAELLQHVQRIITEELVLAYFETQYQNPYINEAAIREAYEQMGRQVVYRQLIIPKPEEAPPEAIDALEATVAALRDQLEAGRDFAELEVPSSPHAAPARTATYGVPVTWRKSLTSPRNYIIFNLDPGAARALETQSSYHLIRVERHEEVPVDPFDEVRDEIVETLRARYMPAATRAFEREKHEAVDTSSITWHQDGVEQVVAWSNTPNFYEQDYQTVLAEALASGDNFVIMTHAGGQVDVQEFCRLLSDVLILGRSGSHDAETIKDFILEAVRTDIIADRARQLGLLADVMSPHTTSSVLRNRIVQLYNQRVIEPQIPEATDTALRTFHKAHQDSLFYQLAVVNTYALIRSDKAEAEALWEKVEQGVPFEELSDRRAVKSFVRNRDGTIDSYKSREAPYLGEVAFDLAEDEVRGPIMYEHAEEGTQYAIIKRIARREERPLQYDEVADTISETFTDYHRARIAAEVAADLRDRYPVTIHRDVLDRVLAESR